MAQLKWFGWHDELGFWNDGVLEVLEKSFWALKTQRPSKTSLLKCQKDASLTRLRMLAVQRFQREAVRFSPFLDQGEAWMHWFPTFRRYEVRSWVFVRSFIV